MQMTQKLATRAEGAATATGPAPRLVLGLLRLITSAADDHDTCSALRSPSPDKLFDAVAVPDALSPAVAIGVASRVCRAGFHGSNVDAAMSERARFAADRRLNAF